MTPLMQIPDTNRQEATAMLWKRWIAILLVVTLFPAGCSTSRAPDPMGHASLWSDLVPRRAPQRHSSAEHRQLAATDDPFIQPPRDVDLNQLGRAMVSDSSVDELAAHDTSYIAGQPLTLAGSELVPAAARDAEAAAAEQAANLLVQSQLVRASRDETALQRRLRELEFELQFTEDHAMQDQLALEIAQLRRQLRNSAD